MDMTALKVVSVRDVALDIVEYRLADPAGAPLPAFNAGAHLHVSVPAGGTRQYSLCNDPAQRDAYVIAVKREADGKGGSVSLIEGTAPGDLLQVSAPVNDFELAPASGPVTLIAGGIGITPVLAMARVLQRSGHPFHLYYLARSPELTAYDADVRDTFGASATVHHDHGDPARSLDLRTLLAAPDANAQIYCCGPTGLLRAVRSAAEHWPRGSVRFEDFGTTPQAPADAVALDGAAASDAADSFWVSLEGSDKRVHVGPEQSILQALQEAGLEMPSSCEAGTCGTCRMRLVSGEADHRDLVLFDDEMDDNIIICCSRAKTPELVLARD